MSGNIDDLRKRLAEAESTGNKASAGRLERIIGNLERNKRNREADANSRKRKNESEDASSPKRFRFVDASNLGNDMSMWRDMLREARDRDTAQLKREEEGRNQEEERRHREAEAEKKREQARRKYDQEKKRR